MSMFSDDSAVRFFFGPGPVGDVRGIKFAEAMMSDPSGKSLRELCITGNFDNRYGLHDDDVHPEVLQFLEEVSLFHCKIFSHTLGAAPIMGPSVAALARDPATQNLIHALINTPRGTPEYNFFNLFMNAVHIAAPPPPALGPVAATTTMSVSHIGLNPDTTYLNLTKADTMRPGAGAVVNTTRFSEILMSAFTETNFEKHLNQA